jgi:hypothetical protein
MRCGSQLHDLGERFFVGEGPPYDVRLKWQRAALELLASKLARVQKHTEYQQDTGFQAPGYKRDTRPPQPGTLAWDAWNQISEETPAE